MKTIKNSNTVKFKIEDIIMFLENIDTTIGCSIKTRGDCQGYCGSNYIV